MVPNGWEVKILDSVSKVIDCKHRTPKYVKEGVPLVSPGTIKWGALDLITPTKRVSTEEYSSLMDHCTVNVGDLVLSRNQSVGVASFVESEEPFVLGQDTVLVKPTEANSRFLFYNLQSVETQRTIFKLAGGSTFSRINLSDIRKLKAIYPPLPEQRKIAKILSTWDKAISTTERLIDNSKQQKKALMQQLLTGAHTQRKRLLDDSGKPFEGEWEDVCLGDFVTIKSGVSPSNFELKAEGEVPYVKVEDMNNCNKYQKLSRNYTDVSKSLIIEGAVIFPKRGAAIMNNKVRIAASSLYLDSNMMALIPNNNLISEFLYYLLIKEELFRIADTSTIPQINNKHITPYRFNLPSLDEQVRVTEVLINADKEIELLEQQLADLKQEKKALMQQLLTGKRRVKVEQTDLKAN